MIVWFGSRRVGEVSHGPCVLLQLLMGPATFRFFLVYIIFPVIVGALGAIAAGCGPGDPRPTDLVTASSKGDVDYTLSGTGDSSSMTLRIRNKTRRIWIVEVEVGMKLEPAKGDVQAMVVTKEVHVTVHPHEETTVEVEVACLDISKPPPSKSDISWTLQRPPQLRQFINCVNGNIDDLKKKDPDNSQAYEENRTRLIQAGLWQARGASREQWIDFYERYAGQTPDEARQIADMLEPFRGQLIKECPSLAGV